MTRSATAGESPATVARRPASASAAGSGSPSSTLGLAAHLRNADEDVGRLGRAGRAGGPRARGPRSRGWPARRGSGRAPPRARRSRAAAPGTAPRRPARSGSPAARRRPAPRTGRRAPRPCRPAPGRRAARCPPAGTRASARGAGAPRGRRARGTRSAGAGRRSGSAWRPGARSGRSCPCAGRAPRRGRRRRGRPGAGRRRPRRSTLSYSIAGVETSPKPRRSKTAAQRVGDRAQLAHLVGQDVTGAAGDRMDHGTRCGAGRAAQATGTAGCAATRSMRAPSARSRSSMRS